MIEENKRSCIGTDEYSHPEIHYDLWENNHKCPLCYIFQSYWKGHYVYQEYKRHIEKQPYQTTVGIEVK